MTKVFQVIRLPLQLRKQQQFSTKIQQINLNVSQNIECLKIFIQHSHEICYKSSKQINKLITSSTKKLNLQNREDSSFSNFLYNLLQLTQCMENQLNKIIIFMKSKKYESIKRMNETINIKLKKTGQSVYLFINMVKEYNTLGQKYFKKAEYFRDIQKNAMHYYSFGKNQQKYKEIIRMQQQLQLKLDSITTLKGEIRVMMIQLTVKISQFYEIIRLKVEQFRRAAQTVLEKVIELIRRFSDKISQASQEDEQSMRLSKSNHQIQLKQIDLKMQKRKNSESNNIKHQIKQMKKERMADIQKQKVFQQNVFDFIQNFQGIVKEAYIQLDALQNQSSYRKKFVQERALMVEILPKRCIQDIDMITEVHQFLQGIFYGMEHIVGKPVFTQIFQRQKIYNTRFLEQIEKTFELPLDDMPLNQQTIVLNNIILKQKRYAQQHLQWKKNLQKLFDNMINRIKFQFMKKNNTKNIDRQDKKSELFSQKSFQILKADYFSSGPSGIELLPFMKSDYIINYEKITKSDRIKNIAFQIEEDRIKTMQNISQRQIKKVKSRSSCCGLIRNIISKQKKQDPDLVKKLKNSKQVDGYTCALKNGLMLFQGKLTIYTDYMRFKSSFNPNTFFGSTDIFIPKYDIYEIIRGKHIMSLMITIVTKRGSIQFTSFFSDPFQILLETYMSNRNTQYQAATCQQMHPNDQNTQLDQLKQKMKKQFVQLATQQRFKVNNVKVKEQQNQVQIQYNYNDLQSKQGRIQSISHLMVPMIFRITVKHFENSLEYDFWHCESQNKKRRKQLQNIAIKLINEDRVQKIDNFSKEARQKEKMDDNISFNMGQQLSIISSMQKHQLDFGESGFLMNLQKNDNHGKNIDILMIENETKNNSLFTSPKISKKKLIEEPKQNILNELQESNIQKESERRSSFKRNSKQILERSRLVIQNSNKTNKDKEHNVSVSSNASTVKYGERQKRVQKTDSAPEIKQNSYQGMKNLLLLLGIAYGLICIIKLFL